MRQAVRWRDIPIQTVCELLHFELFNIKDRDVCVLTLKTADGSLGNFHKIGGIFLKKSTALTACQVHRERSPTSGLIA